MFYCLKKGHTSKLYQIRKVDILSGMFVPMPEYLGEVTYFQDPNSWKYQKIFSKFVM